MIQKLYTLLIMRMLVKEQRRMFKRREKRLAEDREHLERLTRYANILGSRQSILGQVDYSGYNDATRN